MGKLLELAIYNPSRLSDEDFLMGFVARLRITQRIVDRLRQIKPDSLAQHRLLVGQRGMGKTSLLRRLAIEVQHDPDISGVLLPLTFREEQYNIHSLHVLWCNCLDSLGDYFEASNQIEKARDLDQEVAKLERTGSRDGHAAFELFRAWFKREGRRPLLLIDNLDIVFGLLAEEDEWSLRRVMQEAGGIVLIGASTSALEAAVNPNAAFYEFFQVDVLDRLNLDEVKACLSLLSGRRGEAGKVVKELLTSDPARVQVLHDLTGGNPRTLTMLYLVLEATEDDDLMVDLERLLDQATPLYKARVEELALQARVVFDAVALNWDPVTAADLAVVTTLEINTVSTQLDRLVRDGVVEKTSLANTRRAGFQVAERFFNIWYLMRHGPRRQRQRLRWLTETLRRIYTPSELEGRAKAILEGSTRAESSALASFCLAVSDALDEGPLRASLFERALRFDPRLRVEPEDTADLAGRRRAQQDPTEDSRTWLELGDSLWPADRMAEAAAAYRKATELEPTNSPAWNNLGAALSRLTRFDEAEVAFRRATELDPNLVPAWIGLGGSLLQFEGFEEAESTFRRATELDANLAPAWLGLGISLDQLNRFAEAEVAFRRATELDPNLMFAWSGLGGSLRKLERFDEAETAFRRAIELDPNLVLLWSSLGSSLRELQRFDEAEAAFRRAIELDPNFAHAWRQLGSLLLLHRLEEAETAFRRATELDPQNALAWWGLGQSLFPFKRFEEAVDAFRRATDMNPKIEFAWFDLGTSLDQLQRPDEAEIAYRRSLEVNPALASSWINLGWLLNERGQFAEAAAALQNAVTSDQPPDSLAVNALDLLGNLLADQLHQTREAEEAYLHALSIDQTAFSPRNNLCYLLLGQGRLAEANEHYSCAISNLPAPGAQLLRAYRHLTESEIELALGELETVLMENPPTLLTTFRDDLLRFLRLAASKGWGDHVLEWFDRSGISERFRPVRFAYEAYLHGAERLRDVNPEVRGGAQRLLTELGPAPGSLKAAGQPAATGKTKRGKRKV